MKLLRFAVVPVFGSLALLGCGSAETGGNNNNNNGATVNEAAGKQVAAQLATAVTKARTGSDGPGAAFAIASAGQSAQGIVTASGGYMAQAHGEKIGAAHQKDVSGSADCTATGCTFKSYADSSSAAAWTIDGTLSWADDKLICDLTMSGDVAGSTYTLHEKCNLAVTDTSIDGTFESDGSASVSTAGYPGAPAGGANVSWSSTVTFNAVKYSTAGCPTSGSIDVDAETTANGYSASGTGDVTFDGSGC